MKLLGAGAAMAAALQLLVLTWPSGQGALVAAATFVGFWQLWCVREHLNQHVDMILLMTGYGGAAMLPFAPTCHSSAAAFWMMNAAMLAAGIPAVCYGARCIRQADRPALLLVLDSMAMIAGMALPHFLVPAHDIALHHGAMLTGMLAGMGVARVIYGWRRVVPARV